jgi:hypothetical protein
MALNIPNTDLPGASFLKGIDTGSTMFSRLMHPVLEREKQKQQAEQFAQELALKKQQEARMGANSGLNRQILEQNLLKLKHSNDPHWAMQQLQEKLDYIQNLGKQGQQGGAAQGGKNMGQEQQPPVNFMDMINQGQEQEMPQGQGAMMPQEEPQQQEVMPEQMQGQEQMQPGQQGQASNQLPGGIDMDEIKRALTYQALGLKVPTNGIYKEPPQIKRMNDLRSKMEEAKYKHELKLAEEQQKIDLKNEATRSKTIESAKNDIPHLKDTLRSLKVMKKIADDPKNSDMFGHWWLGHDKAAQRMKNPNAGAWQVHGLAPIVDAEMKMSSKGNIVALKSAQANKPNFAEDQSVAQSKLKAQIDQIERRIKDTEKIANQGGGSSAMVVVIDPNGQRFETTKENADHLPQGWKHG